MNKKRTMEEIDFKLELENIKQFIPISENELIIIEGLELGDHVLSYWNLDEKKKKELLTIKEMTSHFFSSKNKIWINKGEGFSKGSIVIDKESLKIDFTDNYLMQYRDCDDFIICMMRNSENEKYFGGKYIRKKEIEWVNNESSTINHLTNERLYYLHFEGIFKPILKCLDAKNGREIWSFDIRNHFDGCCIGNELTKILGVYKNEIFLVKGKNEIISIDEESGRIKMTWSKMNIDGENVKIPNSFFSQYIDNKVVGIVGKSYWEINHKTNECNGLDIDLAKKIRLSYWQEIHSKTKTIPFKGTNYDYNNGIGWSNCVGEFCLVRKNVNWVSNFDFSDGDFIVSPGASRTDKYYLVNTHKGKLYSYRVKKHGRQQ